MIWLIAAMLAFGASVGAQRSKADRPGLIGRLGFYVALVGWIWSEAGQQAFIGNETSLLGWFVIGLVLFAAGEATGLLGKGLGAWSLAAAALAALSFAAGFDVLRIHHVECNQPGFGLVGIEQRDQDCLGFSHQSLLKSVLELRLYPRSPIDRCRR